MTSDQNRQPDAATVDVSLLVTFHSEGILAHATLNSLERCRLHAESQGITAEYVFVFDAVNDETRRVVLAHPAAQGKHVIILDEQNRDLGFSRNAGIRKANGKAVAILDGDDFYSTNWIAKAFRALEEYGPKAIVHTEFVINFGAHLAYCWQVDQRGKYFNADGMLFSNCWTSWCMARREVFTAIPYAGTRSEITGYGYEDWHWNCQTIAAGYEHLLAWGTVGFYRRKRGSLVANTVANGAIIRPSDLFALGAKAAVGAGASP